MAGAALFSSVSSEESDTESSHSSDDEADICGLEELVGATLDPAGLQALFSAQQTLIIDIITL